jgi:hypothetical protein
MWLLNLCRDWLGAERSTDRSSSPRSVKNFDCSISSRPAAGPTQPRSRRRGPLHPVPHAPPVIWPIPHEFQISKQLFVSKFGHSLSSLMDVFIFSPEAENLQTLPHDSDSEQYVA